MDTTAAAGARARAEGGAAEGAASEPRDAPAPRERRDARAGPGGPHMGLLRTKLRAPTSRTRCAAVASDCGPAAAVSVAVMVVAGASRVGGAPASWGCRDCGNARAGVPPWLVGGLWCRATPELTLCARPDAPRAGAFAVRNCFCGENTVDARDRPRLPRDARVGGRDAIERARGPRPDLAGRRWHLGEAPAGPGDAPGGARPPAPRGLRGAGRDPSGRRGAVRAGIQRAQEVACDGERPRWRGRLRGRPFRARQAGPVGAGVQVGRPARPAGADPPPAGLVAAASGRVSGDGGGPHLPQQPPVAAPGVPLPRGLSAARAALPPLSPREHRPVPRAKRSRVHHGRREGEARPRGAAGRLRITTYGNCRAQSLVPGPPARGLGSFVLFLCYVAARPPISRPDIENADALGVFADMDGAGLAAAAHALAASRLLRSNDLLPHVLRRQAHRHAGEHE